jgi:hypothetical protein
MAPKKRSGSRTSSGSGSPRSGRAGPTKKNGVRTSKPTSGSGRSSARSTSAPADALAAIAKMARELRARWYLFGAQAAVIWGKARTTADLDVTIEIDPGRVDELLRAARRAGLREREENVAELARVAWVVPLVSQGGFPLDVVLAGTGLERRFLDRVARVRVGRLQVPVISPEDLIVTKLIAGRPRDLEDIRGVLAERGRELDQAYVRALVSEIESGLELSGLLARWEQLVLESEGG